jgi:peptidoglycan/LPS O-acetylase OafA/YrhL
MNRSVADPPMVTQLVGSARGGRYAALEGYRGLAAVAVLVFHLWLVTWPPSTSYWHAWMANLGNFGVSVFFVLSGVVLFMPISRALSDGTPVQPAGRFLLRRFFRIYPAFWVAITAWAWAVPMSRRVTVEPVKVFLLLNADERSLGLAWTLRVEVCFYLFIAIVGFALGALCRRPKMRRHAAHAQLSVIATMLAVAWLFRWWATADTGRLLRQSHAFPMHLDWFAIGMLLAILAVQVESNRPVHRAIYALADHAGACVMLAVACYASVVVAQWTPSGSAAFSTRTVPFVWFVLQPVAAGFLLLPVVAGRADQWLKRWLCRPWPSAIGTVSYGVYLWHWIILVLLQPHLEHSGNVFVLASQAALLLAITLVVATLSYRLIERPAMEFAASMTPPLKFSRSEVWKERTT